jgi:small ligand-binding sensory domain FIST
MQRSIVKWVAVQIATAVSTGRDPLEAGAEAAGQARRELGESAADVVLVFASGAHLAAPEALLEVIRDTLSPGVLIGCGAGGVLGDRRELEDGTAVSLWTGSFPDGRVRAFHATATDVSELEGVPEIDAAARGMILLADPFTFAADRLLDSLAVDLPGLPVLGGLASARSSEGSGVLMLGDEVVEDGAVGLVLDDIELLPCVSQGAAPLGPELTITAAEGNVIEELAGRPAVETLQRVVAGLPAHEQGLVAAGLLIGIVIDSAKTEYEQGDFLVRGIAGADPASGRLAVGAIVNEGQVIRLHARDARSADEDLRRQLRLRRDALSGSPPAGAAVFSCNGRGAAMFGTRDHDAVAIAEELGDAPAAGFFAAGEIGPVGGRSFLHGFTAPIAVFPQ